MPRVKHRARVWGTRLFPLPGLDFWVQRWEHSSGMDELVLGSSGFSLVFWLLLYPAFATFFLIP